MALKIWTGTTSGDYSVAGNWSPSGVPVAADDVLIQGSVSITAGLDQSAVAIDEFVVDPGYTGTIGTATGYLKIDPNSFDFAGTGKSYINLGVTSGGIGGIVRATASASTGQAGLYLLGSSITTLTIIKGAVGVAVLPTETATITTANLLFLSAQATDANLILGSGVTLTNLNMSGGACDLRCAATTIIASAGTLTTRGTGAITTLTNNGATIYPTSTGLIGTLNAHAGTTDFRRSLTARTVTTVNSNGDNAVVLYDTAITTFTNKIAPSGNVRVTIAQD